MQPAGNAPGHAREQRNSCAIACVPMIPRVWQDTDAAGQEQGSERAMARARAASNQGASQRRITAPVDDSVFRSVGAFCKWRGLALGTVVQAALVAYLKDRGWKLGSEPTAEGDDAAA